MPFDWIDGLMIGIGSMYIIGIWRRHRRYKPRAILVHASDSLINDSPQNQRRRISAMLKDSEARARERMGA